MKPVMKYPEWVVRYIAVMYSENGLEFSVASNAAY